MYYYAKLRGDLFEKFAALFALWTLLLVATGSIVQVTDFSQLAPVGFTYRAIDSAALLAGLIVAVGAWRFYGQYRFGVMLILGGVAFTLVQSLFGTTFVWVGNHALAEVAHILLVMLTLAIGTALLTAIQTSRLAPSLTSYSGLTTPTHKFFFQTILLMGGSLVLLLTTGALVTGSGAALACPDWPLCRGEIFPAIPFEPGLMINLLHRFTTVIVGVLVVALVLQTHRRYAGYRRLVMWSRLFGLLFLGAIALGGLYMLTPFAQIVAMMHLTLAGATWCSLIALGTVAYLTLERAVPLPVELKRSAGLTFRVRAFTFFKLTKPWILVLLLLTTITAMFIAARGLPSLALLLYTLVGGALSAGGASVLNSYIDSDIDQLMSRTSRRATVTGLVTPQETLLFGLLLSALSFLILAIFVNTLSAILSTIGIFYYVFFYTLYLKRSTIHNIIIGGAAGAIPPLVGWTAVTNSLDLGAFYLFAIIFFWTPPHTWALALLLKKDYAQARVPMLPVVVGEKETTYQIFLYSILLIVLTLLPFTFQMVSWLYLLIALILGARFIYLAWKLWQNFDKSLSRKLYKFSQAYLALLFIAMAIDRSLF